MNRDDEVFERACTFAERNNLRLSHGLGYGIHGSVWAVESHLQSGSSAIKVLYRQVPYHRERDVYQRLRDEGVNIIRECMVPLLLHCDDELLVIQITIVTRPFILDFAAAYLDEPPEFSEEVWADWRQDKEEQFGSQWPEVQAVMQELRNIGIHQTDVSPGNISLPEI
jgi:hypothetical protein